MPFFWPLGTDGRVVLHFGPMQQIFLAADHAGFALKEQLKDALLADGYAAQDLGTSNADRVDYPEFGAAVGRAVAQNAGSVGLAVCGSGVGVCMAANRFAGARAAVCATPQQAQLCRAHNNANVLCLGARFVSFQEAREVLKAFLDSPFEGGRHQARVDQLGQL